MELTQGQEKGLKIALARYSGHELYTCIAGYGGTGKSTLVTFIIDALNIHPEDVAYIAYTGKAALVLKEKGCPNAMTAHKLLYNTFYDKKTDEFKYVPKRPLDHRYKLIVVDEVSMLPQEMWELLLSHYIHVIALGDPGQLPPIQGTNDILNHPHIFLTEVMRQAQESEIIRLSMDVRAGRPLSLMDGKQVKVINQRDITNGMYTWADTVICGTNRTRYKVNRHMRNLIWDTDQSEPIIGDKIVCNHNDWRVISSSGEQPLINGLIGEVTSIKPKSVPIKYMREPLDIYVCGISVNEGNDKFKPLWLDGKLLKENKPIIDKNNYRYLKSFPIKEFEYGYAITCHKSQGSEYNKVLVLEEDWPNQDHQRWLYTAITRAIDKLVIIRNYR